MNATSQGSQMLESFVSVGVIRFDVVRTTISKEGRGYWSAQPAAQARSLLPSLIESSAREQLNVIVRPHADPLLSLIQLDDIRADQIARIRSLAFLLIQTSPGRHQAWLAVEGCDGDFCQRVKRAAGADMGANGWVRLAGSFNVKPPYKPDFPTVQVVDVRPGLKAAPATLYLLGLVADRRVASSPPPARNSFRPKRFPSYQRFLDGAPIRSDGERDRSLADFTFCCAAIRWGWSIEETAAQLMREPLSKAAGRGWEYAMHTAKKAAAAVAGDCTRCTTVHHR